MADNRNDEASTRYAPSASDRVRAQVASYEATDGAEGGELGGRPVVILTTVGARSGAIRKTPIMKVVDGDRYVAIASYAGSPTDPAWYRNLVAQPEAQLQDGAARVRVRAREVTGTEKARLWEIADASYSAYADYRARAGREIPILVLDRVPADTA
jgi:deazaflavin-dependent oxidoreductase (nitroreductase family)